jgi:hypothetical protein
VLHRIEPIYNLHVSLEKCEAHFFRGAHPLPDEAPLKAIAWLERRLTG